MSQNIAILIDSESAGGLNFKGTMCRRIFQTRPRDSRIKNSTLGSNRWSQGCVFDGLVWENLNAPNTRNILYCTSLALFLFGTGNGGPFPRSQRAKVTCATEKGVRLSRHPVPQRLRVLAIPFSRPSSQGRISMRRCWCTISFNVPKEWERSFGRARGWRRGSRERCCWLLRIVSRMDPSRVEGGVT